MRRSRLAPAGRADGPSDARAPCACRPARRYRPPIPASSDCSRNSVEEVAVLLDVCREIERMLAHQPFGEFRVALLERLDDAHVIDNRALRAVALRDRHAANG